MNNSFCTRISYFIMSIVVYLATINLLNILLPDTILKISNTITNDTFSYIGTGALLGGGVAITTFIVNIILGFVLFKKFKYISLLSYIYRLTTIFTGMVLNGFTEELIYRGLLIGVTKQFLDPTICVILSSFIFGYVHIKYSIIYSISAFISGLLLGFGYLQFGLYWCIGFHLMFNFIEYSLYSLIKVRVLNKFMGGERKLPDDDGITTAIINLIVLYSFFRLVK